MSKYSERMVEDAIEIHGPDGVRKIAMPGECDITRVGAMVLQLMEAAGYEYMRPQCGGAFAFTPRVEPDELRDDIPGTFDPGEGDGDPIINHLRMIPGTRVYNAQHIANGYVADLYDYMAGRPFTVRLDYGQIPLRPAGGE